MLFLTDMFKLFYSENFAYFFNAPCMLGPLCIAVNYIGCKMQLALPNDCITLSEKKVTNLKG